MHAKMTGAVRSVLLRRCPVRPWQRPPDMNCQYCLFPATGYIVDGRTRTPTCPVHFGEEIYRLHLLGRTCVGYPTMRQTWVGFGRAVLRRLKRK